MTVKGVLARHALAVFVVVVCLCPNAPAWAARVSLAWNPSSTPTVAGYKISYGLASGNYTSSTNIGTNTSATVTGLIFGNTYYFAVLAYNVAGVDSPFSNEAAVSFPVPPVISITSGPAAQTVMAGQTATLAVSANSSTGAMPLTYQWFNGTNALAGATNATLILPNVCASNAGCYSVVITSSAGSVTSSVAPLQMVGPPKLSIARASKGMMVSWPSLPAGFTLQQTKDLAAPHWTASQYALSPGAGTMTCATISTPPGNVFFRLVNQTAYTPQLTITHSENNVVVSWPSSAAGFALQQNANLAAANWMAASYPIMTNGPMASVTISSPQGNLFFRLAHL